MVYLDGTSRDITIDRLIKFLQEAKKDLGGKTKVVLGHDSEFRSIELISAELVEGSFGYYEWVGDPDEDEEIGEDVKTVLALTAVQ